jgi:hypothetical protein
VSYFSRLTARGLDPYLVISFVAPFFVSMLTLAPSVTFFDSGEFITAIA